MYGCFCDDKRIFGWKWLFLNHKKTFFLQVWAGNDDCEEVTWQECTLIDSEVDFNITEIVCKNTTQIPWMDCEDTVKEQMTMNMTCEPKAALDCRPVTETLCTTG